MKLKYWLPFQILLVIGCGIPVVLFGLISLVPFQFIQNLIQIPLILYDLFPYLFILAFVIFILLLFKIFMAIFDRFYVHENMELGDSNKYAAVIIVKKKRDDDMTLYENGIGFLLMYFNNIGKSYKVFAYPQIEKFKEIVCDENIDELYIFGHGTRGQLKFEDTSDGLLKYSDFEKYNLTKKFVGQYHCNSCKQRKLLVDILFLLIPSLHTCDLCCEKSLAEYLNAQEEDVTKKVRIGFFTQIKFIRKWFKSSLIK